MKIYNVVITSNDDGNVTVTVMPFSDFNNAAKYLHSEYLDIKAENDAYDITDYENDDVHNLSADSSDSFYLEDESGTYWCSGNIAISEFYDAKD